MIVFVFFIFLLIAEVCPAQRAMLTKQQIFNYSDDLNQARLYANAKFGGSIMFIHVGYKCGGLLPLQDPVLHREKFTESFLITAGISFSVWGLIEHVNINKAQNRRARDRL
jgi:hypothetical protein